MAFPFDPATATLWTLTRMARSSPPARWRLCRVEGRVLINGNLLYARTFPTADETLEWAEQERKDQLARGWLVGEPAME